MVKHRVELALLDNLDPSIDRDPRVVLRDDEFDSIL